MTRKLVEVARHNIITAFIVVALPLIAALAFLGYVVYKGFQDGWGWGFTAILIALIVQYPYLKFCDRYFFK